MDSGNVADGEPQWEPHLVALFSGLLRGHEICLLPWWAAVSQGPSSAGLVLGDSASGFAGRRPVIRYTDERVFPGLLLGHWRAGSLDWPMCFSPWRAGSLDWPVCFSPWLRWAGLKTRVVSGIPLR